MKAELNDRYLRSLKAPDSGRLEISDTKRKGLRFRLYASAGEAAEPRAVWMYEKRVKGGVKRKHTLGQWPAVGLKDAREQALAIEAEASQGIDRVVIAEEQKLKSEAAKAGMSTVRQVLVTYEDLHLSTIRTRSERRRQLDQSLAKHLNKSISALTRKDLQEAIDQKAQQGRKPYANRIRAALVAFANWCYVRGYVEEPIGAGIAKATKETARDRVPSLAEVRAIWQATYSLGDFWGPLFRLVILTGQRRSEITKLKWAEIDWQRAQIVKPGSVTKNGRPHTTHLSAAAMLELTETKVRAKSKEYVFSLDGEKPVAGIAHVKKRLDETLGDDFEPWRIHDLRTGMASTLANAGEPENVVDRILNHSASGSAPSAVARVYNQAEQLPQRAKALDKWTEMVTGEAAKVVRLAN